MAGRATTVDQQIELLRSRGMDIEDEVKAKEILLDVGYYRLGFYWYPFEKDNKCKNRLHKFIEGASFKDAVDLYYFDYQLKNIILKYISRIEINLRTKLIYIVSNQYPDSPTWFADPSIVNHKHVKDIVQNYTNELLKHNPVLRSHHKKYINDKFAPAWKTIEFMPLGSVQYLYINLKDQDIKQKIANEYYVKHVTIFENYIEAVRNVRNACAHGNILYDLHLPKAIRKGPAGSMTPLINTRLSGAIKVIAYLVKAISTNRYAEMLKEISDLENSNQYKAVLKKLNINFSKLL